MKVIVAGGSGLIGRLLIDRLLENGHIVWVLSRNPAKALFPARVKVVQWDGRSGTGWQHLVEEAHAIVNLTGENLGARRWTPERKELLRSSRIEPARAIVQAVSAAGHRPKVFLQASAVGYYGPRDDRILDEESPAGTDPLSRLVVDWEKASEGVEELGVRRIVVRQGIVLDDSAGALPRMLLPFRLFAGGPIGGGRQWISWISRQDVAGALLFLLQSESANGVYNLTAPEPLTNADFGRAIARVLKRPYWLPVPAFALRIAFGEMATVVLDGQRVRPGRLLAAGYRFQHPDLQSALEALFRH